MKKASEMLRIITPVTDDLSEMLFLIKVELSALDELPSTGICQSKSGQQLKTGK